MKCILMNKNMPVVELELDDDTATILKVMKTCELDFLPIGIDVKTGNGVLRLIKVKPEGKGEMFARDWGNGLRN